MPTISDHASLTIAGALAAGVLAITVSRHLRTPGIIILLLVGVGMGADGLNLIVPSSLGPLLTMIVGMAVAVILFEGGLHLDLKKLKHESAVINQLISIGAIVTAVLSALVAWFWMGWDKNLCILFGTLVIVTGPTVVTPLLRKLRIKKNISTILEAEGVLIDPVGAIIAVVALDFVIRSTNHTETFTIFSLLSKFGLGLGIGVIGGLAIGALLKMEKIVPDELENTTTLAMVLLLFEASNSMIHESGIMTVTVAGMVVGNMNIPIHRKLVDFKEQLTIMLIGILFVLLAADVPIQDIKDLGWPGFATALTVMFLVRPANILSSTIGSDLTWKEKLFMCWIAPRGIVAAAVASLFANDLNEAGIPGGDSLKALVFLVIATTVISQGFTAGIFANILGLRRKQNDGFIIVGANVLGRLLARLLKSGNEDIIIIDRNNFDCNIAEKEGLNVIYGNALEENVLKRANLSSRRGVIGITPNEGLHVMLRKRVLNMSKETKVWLTIMNDSAVSSAMIKSFDGKVLFASRIDIDLWTHRINQKSAITSNWTYNSDTVLTIDKELNDKSYDLPQNLILPLVLTSGGLKRPFFIGIQIRKNDKIDILTFEKEAEKASQWLRGKGFVPTEISGL